MYIARGSTRLLPVLRRLLLGLLLVQECWAAEVQVSQQEALVLPGENATFMCKVPVPLQYCRVEIPGKGSLNLNPQILTDNVRYAGVGLNEGQCGFTIEKIEDKNNGFAKCTLGIASESQESIGRINLIVAKKPDPPILEISGGSDYARDFKIHDTLRASCFANNGRPAANISWYLDDERLLEGLSMPTVIDIAKVNLQSKLQNLTRQLQASDNGKKLKCVASHPAYQNGYYETIRTLFVKYSPQPIPEEPIEQFGFIVGKEGVISLLIEANPKPKIEWTIGDQIIREGQNDNTGRMEAEAPRDEGRGRFRVNLNIAAINKHDTEKQYILTAYNELGRQTYRVRISTNAEPEGVELGIGSIIGIVIGVCVLLLIVFLLIFAKTTGRWCFSDPAKRHLGECSDTESADDKPKKTSILPIKLSQLYWKKKDKMVEDPEDETKPPSPTDERKGSIDTTLDTGLQTEDTNDNNENEGTKEGVVYAELDLIHPTVGMKPVVKNDSDKTEYAEIVYTTKDENKEQTKENK